MTGIVCLAPINECKHHRQATYDATLAERRAERWAGVYRSSSKKTPYNWAYVTWITMKYLRTKRLLQLWLLCLEISRLGSRIRPYVWCLCFLKRWTRQGSVQYNYLSTGICNNETTCLLPGNSNNLCIISINFITQKLISLTLCLTNYWSKMTTGTNRVFHRAWRTFCIPFTFWIKRDTFGRK
jgi:hypothetical protein